MPPRATTARGIGSSQIAALVPGLHPYMDELDLYNALVLGVRRRDAAHLDWGNDLEDPILNFRARALGAARWEHEERFFLAFGDRHLGGHTVRARESAVALASVDDIFTLPDGSAQIDEAKNVGWTEADNWGECGPGHYELQLLWQQGVLGLHRGELVASIGQRAPRAWPVEWDAATYGHLLYLAERFWRDHVIAERPPRGVDGSDAASDYLRARYPHAAQPLELAPTGLVALVDTYCAASDSADDVAHRAELHKQQLCEAIGDREGFELPDGRRITWREQRTAHGGTTRVLRITQPKKARRAA